MLQYSCLENCLPWQRSLAGHSLPGHKELDTTEWPYMHRRKTYLPVAALPQWELGMKAAQLLGLPGPWWRQVFRDTDCLIGRSCGPIRVFFWASCSWGSEGLFGQSFFLALPVQALRGLPCPGSFSVFRSISHIEGVLGWAPTLGLPVRHLKRHPGWGPTL